MFIGRDDNDRDQPPRWPRLAVIILFVLFCLAIGSALMLA